MKKNCYRIAGMVLLCTVLLTIPFQKLKAQDVDVSYQTFYDQLAPYGQWIDDPQYGDVFVPNVDPGFRPYASDGYWAMTDYGNMWMSDEPWAWACYHYGRWTYNSYYGWIWVPGYKWAPAWVSWRSGGGYYGWAPMSPGYRVGGVYDYPDNYWVFVTPGYLYNPHVYSYYERGDVNIYVHRTTFLNDDYKDHGSHYYYGPRREVIERETHQPVNVYHVSNSSRPGAAAYGSGNSVSIYRPSINRESAQTARPSNVIPASHPVGRPEQIAANHATAQPAFRQEHQQQMQQPQSHPQQMQEPQRQQPQMQQPQQRPQMQEPQRQPMQQPQQRPQMQQMQQRPQMQQPMQQQRPQPQMQQMQPRPQQRAPQQDNKRR